MQKNKNFKRGSVIAWIALALAIIALALGWIAFNNARTAVPQAPTESREQNLNQQNVQEGLVRVQMRGRLVALRAEIAGMQASEQAAQEVREAREDIRNIYSNNENASQSELAQIDAQMENIENSVTNNIDEGRDLLNQMIVDLDRAGS